MLPWLLSCRCHLINKMNLVGIWQEKALQEPSYEAKPVYSAMLSVLATQTRATELCLNGNQPSLMKCRLTDEDVSILLQSITNYRILSLNLSYNNIADKGAKLIANHLKTVDCPLQYLNLAYNDITEVGIQIVAEALQLNTSLQHVVLDGLSLDRHGGIQVAAMLQVNTTLTHLSLSNTHLHTDCIIAMATVLRGNRTIKCIDLSRPLLHSYLEESTIHISKMLKDNNTLQEIHLSKHVITDTGIEWICRCLKENTTLLHLDLSCNKLSRDGAKHLADFLLTDPLLSVLNISCNRIENEGLIAISEALEDVNSHLTSLTVCNNSIKDVGLLAMAKALNTNTTLTELYIWGNNWTTPTCNAFRRLLDVGRLQPENTDVRYYEVDGVTYLARTVQHGL